MGNIMKVMHNIFQKHLEAYLKHKSFTGKIFMFHEVSDEKSEWYDCKYSILFDSFKKLIYATMEKGTAFVSPYEIYSKKDENVVLLTFDDAFENVYNLVFPFLKDLNIPFVVFPSIIFINEKSYLKDYMIKEMLQYDGFYLGTHTINHCNLRYTKRKDLRHEIIDPIKVFQEKFDVKADLLAYPYGSVDAVGLREIKYAKEYYSYAFSTLQINLFRNVSPFFLPRLNINENNYVHYIKH